MRGKRTDIRLKKEYNYEKRRKKGVKRKTNLFKCSSVKLNIPQHKIPRLLIHNNVVIVVVDVIVISVVVCIIVVVEVKVVVEAEVCVVLVDQGLGTDLADRWAVLVTLLHWTDWRGLRGNIVKNCSNKN